MEFTIKLLGVRLGKGWICGKAFVSCSNAQLKTCCCGFLASNPANHIRVTSLILSAFYKIHFVISAKKKQKMGLSPEYWSKTQAQICTKMVHQTKKIWYSSIAVSVSDLNIKGWAEQKRAFHGPSRDFDQRFLFVCSTSFYPLVQTFLDFQFPAFTLRCLNLLLWSKTTCASFLSSQRWQILIFLPV